MQPLLDIQAILWIFLLWVGSSTGSPVFSNKTTQLERRQCVGVAGTQAYNCGSFLPTSAQIVARYQDTNDFGRATPQNRVWFYTNLDIGTGSVSLETMLGFCAGWMMGQNIPSYNVQDGCNMQWYEQQQRWNVLHGVDFINNGKSFGTGLAINEIFKLCFFQAAAAAPQAADSYLFTKTDRSWSPRSIWATVEYPELTRIPTSKGSGASIHGRGLPSVDRKC